MSSMRATPILATNTISIKMVRLNTDSLKGSDIWDDLAYELDLLQKRGKTIFSPALTEGDTGQFNSADITLEIVAPRAYLATKGPSGKDYYDRRITTNSISAVIRVLYKGTPIILFTGDMDLIGLEEIVRGGKAINAPILVFPHHGGNAGTDMTSFSQELYDLVKPERVLFSIGRGRYGTPLPEVIATARRLNPNVKISCTQLSERCSASVPMQENTHISAIFANGRDDRHCCAGSITISLSSGGNEFPIWTEHQDFITTFAPSALCRR